MRLYMVSRAASGLGESMLAVALGWQVYQITNSVLSLGMISMAQAIPSLGLALFAGHAADRADRRTILLVTQLVALVTALALAGAAASPHPAVWPIYAVLFVRGVNGAFAGPTTAAILPQLVPPERFSNAVTWRTTLTQLTGLVGPVAGGLLLRWWGSAASVYETAAALSLVAAVALTYLKPQPAEPAPNSESMLRSLREGVRYVFGKPQILGPIALDLFAVLFGGATALFPVYARDILKVGPQGLGMLRAAPSVGAMATALILLHRPPIERSGRAMLVCVAGFGVCMIGFGVSRSYLVSLLLLALSGAADNVSVVIRHTVVQALTPNRMRGRVSAVNSIFIGASNQIGGFESGVAAYAMGTVPSVVFGGAMTILVVIGAAAMWPQLCALGRLDRLGVPQPEEQVPS